MVWHRKVWVRVRENNRNCFPGTKIRTWYTIPRMLYVFSSPSCQKCVRTGPRTFSVKYSTRNEQWQKKRLNHSQLIQTTLSKLSNQIRILISTSRYFRDGGNRDSSCGVGYWICRGREEPPHLKSTIFIGTCHAHVDV